MKRRPESWRCKASELYISTSQAILPWRPSSSKLLAVCKATVLKWIRYALKMCLYGSEMPCQRRCSPSKMASHSLRANAVDSLGSRCCSSLGHWGEEKEKRLNITFRGAQHGQLTALQLFAPPYRLQLIGGVAIGYLQWLGLPAPFKSVNKVKVW